MKNAIKYLLSKRNMEQQELIISNGGERQYSKQYVSKVVNGYFAIPYPLVQAWEKADLLNVPARFFVDEDTGRCKQLNSIDLYELDSYLDAQYFLENENKLKFEVSKDEYQAFPEVEFALREHALKTNITKLQRNIRKDILFVQDVDNKENGIAAQEYNLDFYQNVLELHKPNHLNNDEWRSLFRAFRYVIEGINEEAIKSDNALVYGMYVLIKRARELNATKKERDYQELVDFLLINLESDDE